MTPAGGPRRAATPPADARWAAPRSRAQIIDTPVNARLRASCAPPRGPLEGAQARLHRGKGGFCSGLKVDLAGAPATPYAARVARLAFTHPASTSSAYTGAVGFSCVLPECCARSLRAEVHHRVFRSRGGTDADENLHCHCTACHLRLIHAGHVTVRRQGEVLVYTFRDREIRVFGTPALR